MGQFAADIAKIRDQARAHMEQGAVTVGYKADREQVIAVLNDVLATEILCNLRYRRHYFMAKGMHAETIKAEFLQHAKEEEEHANWVAERITQLGGEPNFNPDGLVSRSHAQYVEGTSLRNMVEENLVAERIAVATYSEIVRWLNNDDPTTQKVIKDILKTEEEHADDMLNFLDSMPGDDVPASLKDPSARR